MTDSEWVKITEAAHEKIAFQQERIALLKGSIAAHEERNRKAGERCGVPYEQHGCDWPDWMAENVLSQAARIAQLEALGPLIEEYGVICTENGMYDANQGECDAMLAEINRILKGGA